MRPSWDISGLIEANYNSDNLIGSGSLMPVKK
jgi:hypothetical protein